MVCPHRSSASDELDWWSAFEPGALDKTMTLHESLSMGAAKTIVTAMMAVASYCAQTSAAVPPVIDFNGEGSAIGAFGAFCVLPLRLPFGAIDLILQPLATVSLQQFPLILPFATVSLQQFPCCSPCSNKKDDGTGVVLQVVPNSFD